VNVGEDTTLGNGDVAEQLVQLLVVADGELEMTGDDTGLLVVTGGVSSQLEDLSREVLKHGGEVDGSTGTDTLSIVALAEKTVDTTDGESETGLGRTTVVMLECSSKPDAIQDPSERRDVRLRPSQKTRQIEAKRPQQTRQVGKGDGRKATMGKARKGRGRLTTGRWTWSRWPCLRICRQSF
jgi:hypothetical protein